MRWLGFAICAALVLTLQTTVAWRLEIRGAQPEWMLVLAVFFALHARSVDALIGAWLLGALMDNYSMARFGLLSGCYALSTLAIYAARNHVFRDNPLTHFAVTFVAAAAVGAMVAVYRVAVGGEAGSSVPAAAGSVLLGAVYTAVWAPPLHHLLLKFPGLLGIRSPRRGYRLRRIKG